MREAHKVSFEKQGLTSMEFTGRAGHQVFQHIHARFQGAQVPIHVFCGIGNNGGDGMVVARYLITHGYNVTVYVTNCSETRSKNFLHHYSLIKDVTKDWPILLECEGDLPEISKDAVVIDAIFGSGLSRPIGDWLQSLIQKINASGAFTISIDLPSGMLGDAMPHAMDTVIRSQHTFTFQTPKLAFFFPETGPLAGAITIVDVGLDPEYLSKSTPLAQTIDKNAARSMYRPRNRWTQKYDYGLVRVLAGSGNHVGSGILTCMGAMHAGAGIVQHITDNASATQVTLPEVSTIQRTQYQPSVNPNVARTCYVVGPGLGMDEAAKKELQSLIQSGTEEHPIAPMVLDADAIYHVAADEEMLALLPDNSILTPHRNELRALLGPWKDSFMMLELAKAWSTQHNLILVIKGTHSFTVQADNVYINTSGNPGLATSSTGDVLAGFIGSLLAQGYGPVIASVFSVYLHGFIADMLVDELAHESLLASDVAQNFGKGLVTLFEPEAQPQPAQPQQQQPQQRRQPQRRRAQARRQVQRRRR